MYCTENIRLAKETNAIQTKTGAPKQKPDNNQIELILGALMIHILAIARKVNRRPSPGYRIPATDLAKAICH